MPEPNTTPYDHTQPGTVTRVVFLVAELLPEPRAGAVGGRPLP